MTTSGAAAEGAQGKGALNRTAVALSQCELAPNRRSCVAKVSREPASAQTGSSTEDWTIAVHIHGVEFAFGSSIGCVYLRLQLERLQLC